MKIKIVNALEGSSSILKEYSVGIDVRFINGKLHTIVISLIFWWVVIYFQE